MTDDELFRVEDQAVTDQAGLERLWRALMVDRSFGGPSVWVLLLDPGGRASPLLPHVEGTPEVPDDQAVDALMSLLQHLNNQLGGSVALLIARPGREINDDDIAWARALADGATRAGVPLWPTHVATDTQLRVIAPDDLARVS